MAVLRPDDPLGPRAKANRLASWDPQPGIDRANTRRKAQAHTPTVRPYENQPSSFKRPAGLDGMGKNAAQSAALSSLIPKGPGRPIVDQRREKNVWDNGQPRPDLEGNPGAYDQNDARRDAFQKRVAGGPKRALENSPNRNEPARMDNGRGMMKSVIPRHVSEAGGINPDLIASIRQARQGAPGAKPAKTTAKYAG